jgi:hypothetical protein
VLINYSLGANNHLFLSVLLSEASGAAGPRIEPGGGGGVLIPELRRTNYFYYIQPIGPISLTVFKTTVSVDAGIEPMSVTVRTDSQVRC